MHYLSLDTVIYRPDGLRDIVLCQYDDVMAELVEVKPSVQLQREFVIGSPWMHQASRGNASCRCLLRWCGHLRRSDAPVPGGSTSKRRSPYTRREPLPGCPAISGAVRAGPDPITLRWILPSLCLSRAITISARTVRVWAAVRRTYASPAWRARPGPPCRYPSL